MFDFKLLAERLEAAMPGIRLSPDADMSAETSFRIGGRAALMVQPSDINELIGVLSLCREAGQEPFILGRGTNVLAADGVIPRVIVKTFPGLGGVEYLGDGLIRAFCGAAMASAANLAAEKGLTGLEFAQGIPGTVGGGVRMNAGAYGGEISLVLRETEYIDREGRLRSIINAEHDFSHRHSVFSENGGVIVSSVFALKPGDPAEIRARMADYAAKRLAAQPLDKPSAGSSFKRPEKGYASAMIDQCGLKGLSIGGAQVSEKHAGFIVNTGGATAEDVRQLMAEVADRVEQRFGLRLEPEIVTLG